MAKKMPPSPPEEGEGWLTSYADLMSLLTCFFMLMMAFANYDPPGFEQKARVVAQTFTKSGAVAELPLEKLKSEMAHHPEFEDRMKITLKDGELVIVFTGSAVFSEGQSLLDQSTLEIVDTLIDMIKSHDLQYRIMIEGHADKDEGLIANMSHWSLSAARAAGVISRFEYFGFKSEKMIAVAKGDREPVAEYKKGIKKGINPREIAKLNRRTVIRVLEPISNKPVRMGFGVLFKDAAEDDGESDSTLFKADEEI
jgi:chemotaxis protein MotB